MPFLQRATLPDDILFSSLLKIASHHGDRIIVDDRSRNTTFGYLDILHGAIELKQKLQHVLNATTLAKKGQFFVALLAPNGYEFITAVLATLALGGVVVPMPLGALPSEAAHILRYCNADLLLVGPEQRDLAASIGAEITVLTVPIDGQVSDPATLTPLAAYVLDKSLTVSEDTPAIVFFTSGTTGPPKGVLHARRTINKYARANTIEAADEICIIPSAIFWSVYWGKLWGMLFLGVRVEIQNFGRNYDLIWEHLRLKTCTKIILSPTFWYGMMVHYTSHIMSLAESQRLEYVDGLRYVRDAVTTGAMPSPKLKDFWKQLRGGKALKILYGSTEAQEISVAYENEYTPEAYLGTPLPGVTMKFSDGDRGEVLVKTPWMFLGYLNATKDTSQSFDSEGFFRTGDLGVRREGRIFYDGRANMDLFKFYTYKVPRLQVESRLLALPYVTEGYIMPLEDTQCDTRVAALIRVVSTVGKVDLHKIRADLSSVLPAYQLPTVLRLLKDHETIPQTWSGKTAITRTIELFFHQDAEQDLVESEIEVMDVSHFMKAKTQKMWDLSGMRQ